jgi:hypothetical protein
MNPVPKIAVLICVIVLSAKVSESSE